jgi:hypothetical protein
MPNPRYSYKYIVSSLPFSCNSPVRCMPSPPSRFMPILVDCMHRAREPLVESSILFQAAGDRVVIVGSVRSSPASLSRETLVEQRKDFRHVELNVLQVQVFLALLLHLQQVVELQIQLQKTPITALVV